MLSQNSGSMQKPGGPGYQYPPINQPPPEQQYPPIDSFNQPYTPQQGQIQQQYGYDSQQQVPSYYQGQQPPSQYPLNPQYSQQQQYPPHYPPQYPPQQYLQYPPQGYPPYGQYAPPQYDSYDERDRDRNRGGRGDRRDRDRDRDRGRATYDRDRRRSRSRDRGRSSRGGGRGGSRGGGKPLNITLSEGDWKCVDCNNWNFRRRDKCNQCKKFKSDQDEYYDPERGPGSQGRGGRQRDSSRERKGSTQGAQGGYIPKEGDWECLECKNINYARRNECNRCKAPKQ